MDFNERLRRCQVDVFLLLEDAPVIEGRRLLEPHELEYRLGRRQHTATVIEQAIADLRDTGQLQEQMFLSDDSAIVERSRIVTTVGLYAVGAEIPTGQPDSRPDKGKKYPPKPMPDEIRSVVAYINRKWKQEFRDGEPKTSKKTLLEKFPEVSSRELQPSRYGEYLIDPWKQNGPDK